MSDDKHVVLINLFEVPAGDDESFVQSWEDARDFMRNQAGYLGTTLHRSLAPDAPYRFVNVALWTSADAFRAAVSHPDFPGRTATHRSHPSLYAVVRHDDVTAE